MTHELVPGRGGQRFAMTSTAACTPAQGGDECLSFHLAPELAYELSGGGALWHAVALRRDPS